MKCAQFVQFMIYSQILTMLYELYGCDITTLSFGGQAPKVNWKPIVLVGFFISPFNYLIIDTFRPKIYENIHLSKDIFAFQ